MSKARNILQALALLMLGGAAGGIVATLLAPRSGEESRAQLKHKSRQLFDQLKATRQPKNPHLKTLSNWGNFPQVEVEYLEFENLATLREIVRRASNVIVRGNGRCYGDSSLAPTVISSLRYNKFVSFDQDQGILQCQAGVLLSEILDVIVPRGWFLPVTPGTKLITVGGAIASNVHGKSQHKAGNFSDHLLDIDLMLSDGSLVTCSPTENADLFWMTCGGMGLTGVIVKATMRLIPIETAYIRQESIKAGNLYDMMALFEQSEAWTYSVAWIDCLATGASLGRGFIMRGEHATVAELESEAQRRDPLRLKPARKLTVPVTFPNFALNTLTVKMFNEAYYRAHPVGTVNSIESYDKFFYPLDSILNWNRIYGKRGFTQYQFILPKAVSRAGLEQIIGRIANSGQGSFLAVLKLYKDQQGYLPFAIDGYSLALDFPITPNLFPLLNDLDQLVLEYGGRLYLTKDVRMDSQMFSRSYPTAQRFIEQLQQLNHGQKFRSFQSDRVGLTS
jgi:FAD/FMN-containing dehydrogenase